MAYTGGFYDNATYGTDDVNGIIGVNMWWESNNIGQKPIFEEE